MSEDVKKRKYNITKKRVAKVADQIDALMTNCGDIAPIHRELLDQAYKNLCQVEYGLK